ncbi:MAG: hypothetical protein MjAS7_2046 [Metallosphaera javensis (ex Sakai et al. 2022)]|nr:MAG: hypothetical protein MjAS7_2046 [Metallosphaera javensis (ex Sakai et al. 2022)]
MAQTISRKKNWHLGGVKGVKWYFNLHNLLELD